PTGRCAALLPLLFLLLAPACRKESAGPPGAGTAPGAGPPPPAEVSVVTVESSAVPITAELPGRLTEVRVAEVRARATGILLKRRFEEGAQVQEGQLLFEIDPAPLEATLKSAEANLAKAEANAAQVRSRAVRYKTLVGKNAVSSQENEDAIAAAAQGEAEILVARAALDTAKLNLGYTKVTAPITGRISEAKVTEGALVSSTESTPLAIIRQLDPIYFDFTQSSTETLRLRRALEDGTLKKTGDAAAEIHLLLDDGTAYPTPGKLLFTGVSVEPTTGTLPLRAEFPTPSQMLLPGMFARARLQQAVNASALTLPQRVVTRNGDGTGTVMVVTPDNKVEPRIIQADRAVGNRWVVSSGLKAGERVIIEGVQKARPGSTVKPVPFTAALAENQTPPPVPKT
ncbi:MAG: acrA, partial [Verrucomicrobiales bacterium]|nr:acrA [Verrucomicrobiales bacterium]